MYLHTLNIPEVDITMTNCSYKKKLKVAFDKLNMVLSNTVHFGRYVDVAVLDMVEVAPITAQSIGNCVIGIFGDVYSAKLPFPAMHALAGGDSKRDNYRNPRCIYKGDTKHTKLAKQFFPWVEVAEEQNSLGKNPTEIIFLNLLRNLRWITLQDSIFLNAVYKRTHFFNIMRSVFFSDLFKGF